MTLVGKSRDVRTDCPDQSIATMEQLLQLPAVGEEESLMRLEQLDQRSRIMELGFERIDLRNPDVVAVRPRQAPPPGHLTADGI